MYIHIYVCIYIFKLHNLYIHNCVIICSNRYSEMLYGILNLLFNFVFSNVVFQTICRALDNINAMSNHCALNAHNLILEALF